MQGVYAIQVIAVNRVYIGSSYNIKGRWNEHKSKLRRGVCDSPSLQKMVDEHGIECLKLQILEEVLSPISESDLKALEQSYIEKFSESGINVAPASVSYVVTLPGGKEVEINNLTAFCNDHDLDQGCMSNIANKKGGRKTHKGYRIRKTGELPSEGGGDLRKKYLVIHPDGTEEEVEGLTGYCKKNDLNGLWHVLSGKCSHHKGYKVKRL